MKDKEFMVEKIRSQYTEAEHTDLDALKALDAQVKRPANVFGYTYGSAGAVVMGAGMSLVMTDIGTMLGMTETLVPGIAVGVVGLAMSCLYTFSPELLPVAVPFGSSGGIWRCSLVPQP